MHTLLAESADYAVGGAAALAIIGTLVSALVYIVKKNSADARDRETSLVESLRRNSDKIEAALGKLADTQGVQSKAISELASATRDETTQVRELRDDIEGLRQEIRLMNRKKDGS
jgi:hypothetical protein